MVNFVNENKSGELERILFGLNLFASEKKETLFQLASRYIMYYSTNNNSISII